MTLEKCANRGVCGNCFVTGYKLLSINFFNALKVLRHDPEQHQSITQKSRSMGKLGDLGRAEIGGQLTLCKHMLTHVKALIQRKLSSSI